MCPTHPVNLTRLSFACGRPAYSGPASITSTPGTRTSKLATSTVPNSQLRSPREPGHQAPLANDLLALRLVGIALGADERARRTREDLRAAPWCTCADVPVAFHVAGNRRNVAVAQGAGS